MPAHPALQSLPAEPVPAAAPLDRLGPAGDVAAPSADAAWQALKARDARFDGRLFVGVTSTGVYCRPVCRVRTPRRENCRFFTTAARAEAARFRPCLKCRPEIAPGLSHTDSSRTLADEAARLIGRAVQDGAALPLAAVAAHLGITDRHLRRIFLARHGVPPRRWVTTQRLLLAKQLLTDTAQPVAQVALASGFDSVRRFNAAFAEHYRLAPTRLRREGAGTAGTGTDALRLAWRPPYDVPAMLGFLARRQLAGVESVHADGLQRTLCWPLADGRCIEGWLALRFVPERCELHVTAAPALGPVLGAVLRRVRDALDLDAEPDRIDAALATLPVAPQPGARLPGAFCGFETAVRVVLGQQVNVAAARTLASRLVQAFGTPVHTPFAGLDRCFPTARTLARADAEAIGRLGIVRQRVAALQALAAAVDAGRLVLAPDAPLEATLQALQALPGIGPWTAQVVAMRVLAWPDAWPAADIALQRALGLRSTSATEHAGNAWRPWRAYAVMRLWHALETSQ